MFRAVLLLVAALSLAPLPAAADPVVAPDDSLAPLVARLLPAVVSISTRTLMPARSAFGMAGQAAAVSDDRRTYLGSGFIIDPSGVIVTNKHVIADAYEITVTLQDQTELKATLIGAGQRIDIAVLRVHADRPLPTVALGDSAKVRVGDTIIAIGNPLGLGGSVSSGIVSALNRDIQETAFDDFIQVDAAINHGSSGGPLFNTAGEVIGMDTALYDPNPNGGFIGVGFALPSNDIRFVVGKLMQGGPVQVGWIGVSMQSVTADIATAAGLPRQQGVIVTALDPTGPGARAGLRPGDVILRYDGAVPSDVRALARLVVQTDVGHVAALAIWRDHREQLLPVKVGEWMADDRSDGTTPHMQRQAPTVKAPDYGLHLDELTPTTRAAFKLPPDIAGVLVRDVTQFSAADDRGMRGGEVIERVGDTVVARPADVQHRLDAARDNGEKFALLLVQGQERLRWVALPLD